MERCWCTLVEKIVTVTATQSYRSAAPIFSKYNFTPAKLTQKWKYHSIKIFFSLFLCRIKLAWCYNLFSNIFAHKNARNFQSNLRDTPLHVWPYCLPSNSPKPYSFLHSLERKGLFFCMDSLRHKLKSRRSHQLTRLKALLVLNDLLVGLSKWFG